MRIAFHAPLKSPDHPIPSGDRRMARGFRDLLCRLGHEVWLASSLRTFNADGSPQEQKRIEAEAASETANLLARVEPVNLRPALWFTYHNYHKAPDLLGPAVSRALNIPLVTAEASISLRRAHGAWARGYAKALGGITASARVLAMTSRDREGLAAFVEPQRLSLFAPFCDLAPFAAANSRRSGERRRLAEALRLDPSATWLVAVAMMRDDVKKRSYLRLAQIMRRLRDQDLALLLVGDGGARPEIEATFTAIDAPQPRFLGRLSEDRIAAVLSAADLMVWPAFGEAYGMALIEAQAAGLPVIAGRFGGVADVIEDGTTGILIDEADTDAFTDAITRLALDRLTRQRMGLAARERAERVHGMDAAASRLGAILDAVIKDRATPC